MARYQHLPIYKDAYALLTLVMEISHKLPREYKYTLGQRMQNKSLDILVDIYVANSLADKASRIDNMLVNLELLGLFVRICMDSKLISPEKYASVVELQMTVLKQATSWKNASTKQSDKVKDVPPVKSHSDQSPFLNKSDNDSGPSEERFVQPDLFGNIDV